MAASARGHGWGLGAVIGQEQDVQGVAAVLRQLTTSYAFYFPDARSSPTISSVVVTSRRHCDLVRAELKFDGSTIRICVKFPKDPKKRSASSLKRVGQNPRVEFETLSYLYEKFLEVPGCAVVRPIALFPEEMAVVTEAAEGANLHDLMKGMAGLWPASAEIEKLKAHCRACGVWLRHFQEMTTQQRRAALPVSRIVEQVSADLEICVQMGLPRFVSVRLLAACEEKLRTIEDREVPVVGEHPDFQPDNILLSPDGVTVLDFTNFQYGSAYNDVARFLASLDFLCKNPLYSRKNVHLLKAAFLDGYGWRPSEMDAALTAYLICYMAKATRTAKKWSYPKPVKRLLERQAVGYLSSWCRRAMETGDARGEHVVG